VSGAGKIHFGLNTDFDAFVFAFARRGAGMRAFAWLVFNLSGGGPVKRQSGLKIVRTKMAAAFAVLPESP
jgi:hypothetical protein